MDIKIKLLFLLVCSPFLIIFVQAIVLRIFRSVSTQAITIICGIAGNIPLGIILWAINISYTMKNTTELFCAILYVFLIYNLIVYVYFHIFNMSETARRIRILYEIYNKKAISDKEIKGIYKIGEMLTVRLGRLISLRQLTYRNDKYLLHKKLLYHIAVILVAWRRILGYSSASR